MGIRKRWSKRLRKDIYYIDYYDLNHQRRIESVGSRHEEAKKVLEARLGDKARGKNPDIPWSKRITFEAFCKEYLEYSKDNKKSWERDITSLVHLKPFFGKKRMDQVSPLDIEKYKQERKKETTHYKKPPTPATINRELALLKNIFNKAVEWGKAKSNPMKRVRLFKESEGRIRFLNEEEITGLLDADACKGNPNLRMIILIALNTGMRKGEILRLQWDQVDWKEKTIYLSETKNGRIRHVPMSDSLTEELRGFKLKHEGGDFVFSNSKGIPFHNVRKSFEKALKEAGIKDFRFHDLRHTFASHLVMGGKDLATVKELLGHRSLNMTFRYAHLSQDHKRDAVNFMSSILTQKSGFDGNKLVKFEGTRERAVV